jgi:hypothetical protein
MAENKYYASFLGHVVSNPALIHRPDPRHCYFDVGRIWVNGYDQAEADVTFGWPGGENTKTQFMNALILYMTE